MKIKLDKLKKLIDDDKSTKFDNPNDIETQIGIEADVNIILKSLEQIVTEDNLIKVFADSKVRNKEYECLMFIVAGVDADLPSEP